MLIAFLIKEANFNVILINLINTYIIKTKLKIIFLKMLFKLINSFDDFILKKAET